MKNRINGKAVAALLACAASAASGAWASTPAELFSRPVDYTDAMLSPTGEYVSVNTPYEDRRALTIIKLSGKYDRNVIKFDAPETVGDSAWTDDTRMIVEKAKDWGYIGGIASTGNIYAADADAGKQQQIFGYLPDSNNIRSRLKDTGSVSLMKVLPGTHGDALFRNVPYVEGNSKWRTTVFRVNTHTGSRKQIESVADRVDIDVDNAGTPRFTTAWDLQSNQVIRYRRLPTDTEWAPAPLALTGSEMNLWFFEADNNHAYMELAEKGEPMTLYRVSVADGTREKVAGNPSMEVTRILRAGHEGLPFAVMYSAGRPKIDYLDPKSEWTQLHAGLMKAFPGQLVEFINFSNDSNKLLFLVHSDRHPGAYYIYDRSTKTPQMLFEAMEWIDPAKMAPTSPIEFKNRSGDTLFGFYTAPLGKQGPHPLVVMPHGGPFGVSDTWGYDADVQFLASLGYAVLRVNFRGSGDRGESFTSSTYQQWGTGIQDDITDGVRYVIGQKLVDPAKVCIYGVSFGGYSAMMNPIRNPGMYKCAIGYAGVYDLEAMYKTDDSSRQSRADLGMRMGTSAEIRQTQSPARNVAKLDVPILLIHGKSDWIAPFDQFKLAETALGVAGKPYETLVKPNEGHGFYKLANRVEAYNRMQAFLLKYNPPN
jgi:dipeptidyl aminopeptidase/acylaminoacyl peptidase